MNKSNIAGSFSLVLLGIVLSVILQRFDYKDFLNVLQWLQCNYLNNGTRETSIGLLTLVEHKKKSFSVAVLPTREVSETTGDSSYRISLCFLLFCPS